MSDALFYVVPALIAVGTVCIALQAVRARLRMRAAWRSGLTARATCLRTYTTTRYDKDSGRSTTRHHAYEFTPPGGRPVSFEEQHGPSTRIGGDIVTVYYVADRPEHATTLPPATGWKRTMETAATVVLCSVVVAFCAFFVGKGPLSW
ncbi:MULTISPECIES: DUF3592 domain-containing protein [unclassified Streptomyces]|uniref:DUF3592 domain-containing protein n=1 Tax=unclassified Streptomyces TaxID=2593676 RepID=UPI002259C4B6|nr:MULTISPECIES: DUF3592 domain-containing protein [unclassified Streptomyces]MCX4548755.1 DUF3592 domain-containing protein [Streptomyces sp. NBC_01500]WSC20345.1 DUF3592 domain-containing protein [Streptomyces sp. NBC_01766]